VLPPGTPACPGRTRGTTARVPPVHPGPPGSGPRSTPPAPWPPTARAAGRRAGQLPASHVRARPGLAP